MEIGFVGNPNIGSIVLNQFKDSEEYKIMASNFNADDRIFIISSIFGGTGAAGFPSVLKIIRNAINQSNIHSKGFLQNAKIGAITALPYFNIENTEKSPIQKSEFIAKSRAALYYYKDNITKNNSINALYYIADDYNGKPYKNDPGNDGQQNPAHFVELISALSVIDFIETPDSDLETINGKASRPIYKSFGMKDDLPENKFSNFEANTEGKISCALSQMVLFKQYINHRLKESVGKQAWSIDEPTIGNAFLNETFFRTHITEFMSFLGEWLKEMAENRRNLAPFNLKTNTIDTLLMDKEVESGWFITKTDFSLYDDKLSKNCKGKSYNSPEQKFIKLFYDTTKEILTSKFGFKK